MRLQQGLKHGVFALIGLVWAVTAQAADRETMRSFLQVTGFDVAITSMQQGAMAGPGLAGSAPDAFGQQWVLLAERVFDPDVMIDRTLDMMEAVLPDDLVDHGIDFYGSDLGQRLVAAENDSHMTPDEDRYAVGEGIVTDLIDNDPDRVANLRAMNDAIGGIDSSIRAIIEIQLRYLMAAVADKAAQASFSEIELRALLEEQIPQLRENIEMYSLLGSAYAYRDFSDDEIATYRAALEDSDMRQVYEILNAIQYEVMAERYEVLASELGKLTPQQDI